MTARYMPGRIARGWRAGETATLAYLITKFHYQGYDRSRIPVTVIAGFLGTGKVQPRPAEVGETRELFVLGEGQQGGEGAWKTPLQRGGSSARWGNGVTWHFAVVARPTLMDAPKDSAVLLG